MESSLNGPATETGSAEVISEDFRYSDAASTVEEELEVISVTGGVGLRDPGRPEVACALSVQSEEKIPSIKPTKRGINATSCGWENSRAPILVLLTKHKSR